MTPRGGAPTGAPATTAPSAAPPTSAPSPGGAPTGGPPAGGAPNPSGPGGPPPGAKPAPEQRLYFADYRDVDGLKLPFRLRRATGSETTEETVFDRYRINAKVDPRRFDTTAK
jgi:hypothetical protein